MLSWSDRLVQISRSCSILLILCCMSLKYVVNDVTASCINILVISWCRGDWWFRNELLSGTYRRSWVLGFFMSLCFLSWTSSLSTFMHLFNFWFVKWNISCCCLLSYLRFVQSTIVFNDVLSLISPLHKYIPATRLLYFMLFILLNLLALLS